MAVVGGGMTAGLLAAGAAERGARVTLVCRRQAAAVGGGDVERATHLRALLPAGCRARQSLRVHILPTLALLPHCRPLKPQPFETEVGWWGAKQLNGYRQTEGDAARLAACRRARK